MKKTKILVMTFAAVLGIGAAVSANVNLAAADVVHDWMDWNGQTVLWGLTQQEAQAYCSGTPAVCLRAKDNVFIYTTGYLIW
ncbi:hypothetical protein SAMN05428949_2453 [Chitinophaga sp. YR627]|uniref:hypothetical protein n=1 Tax=Chitinophaga sp. YR627 TaxID=1881041 RepID=UPI0008EA42F5|nr:hypothetical protein [Chitinophaga sp. YR627]SFN33063.1 hypothetical protein SAMN05428949_2453 [Chitinophaga sp. YR627]